MEDIEITKLDRSVKKERFDNSNNGDVEATRQHEGSLEVFGLETLTSPVDVFEESVHSLLENQ